MYKPIVNGQQTPEREKVRLDRRERTLEATERLHLACRSAGVVMRRFGSNIVAIADRVAPKTHDKAGQ